MQLKIPGQSCTSQAIAGLQSNVTILRSILKSSTVKWAQHLHYCQKTACTAYSATEIQPEKTHTALSEKADEYYVRI